jgi:hypothetical protein
MPDLETLRSLGDRIQPPALALLEETARRRDRRAAVTTVGTGLAAALLVAGGAVALGTADRDRSLPDPITPVSPTPTPQVTPPPAPDDTPSHYSETSMRPREVVHADNAVLRFAGVSLDDPDFRISVWTAECTWCPRPHPESGRPWFNAMALTTDGWRTATYRRPPMGAGRPFYVHSPAPGVLLVVDDSNGGEWLIHDDGSSVRLPRVVEDRPATEPRRWFQCLSGEDQSTWCALDLEAQVVYEWRGGWAAGLNTTASAVPPGSAAEPWGRDLLDSSHGALDAWWYRDGVRQTRVLATPPQSAQGKPEPFHVGMVHGAAGDDLTYFSWVPGSGSLQLHVSEDRGLTWRSDETPAPDTRGLYLDMEHTPEGALIVRDQIYDETDTIVRVVLWRLDPGDDAWVKVHDSGEMYEGLDTWNVRGLTVAGDRLMSGALYSDDDGRTWTEVDRWR